MTLEGRLQGDQRCLGSKLDDARILLNAWHDTEFQPETSTASSAQIKLAAGKYIFQFKQSTIVPVLYPLLISATLDGGLREDQWCLWSNLENEFPAAWEVVQAAQHLA